MNPTISDASRWTTPYVGENVTYIGERVIGHRREVGENVTFPSLMIGIIHEGGREGGKDRESGLNQNFESVHFEWNSAGDGGGQRDGFSCASDTPHGTHTQAGWALRLVKPGHERSCYY